VVFYLNEQNFSVLASKRTKITLPNSDLALFIKLNLPLLECSKRASQCFSQYLELIESLSAVVS
jgi:hypothetical protein